MVLEHLVQLVNTFGGDPGVIIYLYLKRNIESRNNVFKYFNSTSSFVTSTYLCINSRSGGRWIVGEGRYVGQNKVCSKPMYTVLQVGILKYRADRGRVFKGRVLKGKVYKGRVY